MAMASTQAGECNKTKGRRQKVKARKIGYFFAFTFAFCLLLARLWYSDAAEEWRLRRLPLPALERRAAARPARARAGDALQPPERSVPGRARPAAPQGGPIRRGARSLDPRAGPEPGERAGALHFGRDAGGAPGQRRHAGSRRRVPRHS